MHKVALVVALASFAFRPAPVMAGVLLDDVIASNNCYKLHSANPADDAAKETVCRKASQIFQSRKDSAFYKDLKAALPACKTISDLSRFESDRSAIYRLKTPDTWTGAEVIDVLRLDTECRRHVVGLMNDQDISKPDTLAVQTVVDLFLPDVARAKKQATATAAADNRQRGAEEDLNRHVHQLMSEGYAIRSVVDVQVDGMTMVDQKVAVTGYVTVFSNGGATITTNSDDMNGVRLDIRSGSSDVRRELLSRCSSLSTDCRFELKATVEVSNGSPYLRLD